MFSVAKGSLTILQLERLDEGKCYKVLSRSNYGVVAVELVPVGGRVAWGREFALGDGGVVEDAAALHRPEYLESKTIIIHK